MKRSLVLALLAVILVIDFTGAEQYRKNKKHHHRHHKEHRADADPPVILDEFHESANIIDDSDAGGEYKNDLKDDHNTPLYDPCHSKHCGAGKICLLNDNDQPECVCIPNCPVERDPRRKVCTNHNETWGSDCEVHRMRCLCDTNAPDCKNASLSHVHIEYYGECRKMPECKVDEMADFPRRMRDWLFNIMRDLADRQELSPYYYKMQQEAETNLTRRWSNAAIWKWCDLDGHPHDRSVSRHELFPIKAPLMTLEHCIAPFLDKCDDNDDHHITLTEWAKCLEIEQDDIEEQCDDVKVGEDE